VTRFAEFSPNKLLFTLNSFLIADVCSPHVWDIFFHSKDCALIFDKKVLGYVLGEIFQKFIWSP
jgi:hypothetical protein